MAAVITMKIKVSRNGRRKIGTLTTVQRTVVAHTKATCPVVSVLLTRIWRDIVHSGYSWVRLRDTYTSSRCVTFCPSSLSFLHPSCPFCPFCPCWLSASIQNLEELVEFEWLLGFGVALILLLLFPLPMLTLLHLLVLVPPVMTCAMGV